MSVYCGNCHEFIVPENPESCLPLKDGGSKIIPCPCCYGWGTHPAVGKKKNICETCGGKRMVIEHRSFERVKDIK